jgi:Na+/proline symporter
MYDGSYILPALNAAHISNSAGSNPLVDYFLVPKIHNNVHWVFIVLPGLAFLAAAMSTANTFLIVSGHSFVSDLLMVIAKKNTIHEIDKKNESTYISIARSVITGMGVFVILVWVVFNVTGLLNDPLSFFFIAYSIQFALLAPMVFSRLSASYHPSAKAI